MCIKKHIYIFFNYIYIASPLYICSFMEEGVLWSEPTQGRDHGVPKCCCCNQGWPGLSTATGFPAPGQSTRFRAGDWLNHRSWSS